MLDLGNSMFGCGELHYSVVQVGTTSKVIGGHGHSHQNDVHHFGSLTKIHPHVSPFSRGAFAILSRNPSF